jgi:peptidoglycan hydrolase CwlO-like protein
MRALQHKWFLVIVALFSVSIIFTFCDKQQTVETWEQPAPQDSTRTKVQELMLNNQSDIEQNFNLLMKLIEEKEAELKKAQQEMKIKSAELARKQKQLEKIESEIKRLRNFSYFVLMIGLILLIIGIILIRSGRISKQS